MPALFLSAYDCCPYALMMMRTAVMNANDEGTGFFAKPRRTPRLFSLNSWQLGGENRKQEKETTDHPPKKEEEEENPHAARH